MRRARRPPGRCGTIVFSKKAEYGLLALIDLAVQQERGAGGRLTTQAIAARQGLPARFLEQQMTALRQAGLVRSRRGAAGGCALARPAAHISVLDVVAALEGTLGAEGAPVGIGAAAIGAGGVAAGGAGASAVRELVERAQGTLAGLLGSVTIADLARRELELREQGCQMFYV